MTFTIRTATAAVFGAAALLAAAGAPAAPLVYTLGARCVENQIVGPSPFALACPASVQGTVTMPDGYLPGTWIDQDYAGRPLPQVVLNGLGTDGGDFVFSFDRPPGEFWAVRMPDGTGAPVWGWTNPVASFAAGGGGVWWSSEIDLPGLIWHLVLDDAVARAATPVTLPSTLPLAVLAALLAAGVASAAAPARPRDRRR